MVIGQYSSVSNKDYFVVGSGSNGNNKNAFVVNNDNSLISGDNNIILNRNCLITGSNNKTSKDNQIVIGEYNKDNNNSSFIVGNGTASNNRKNTFECRNNGDVFVYRSISFYDEKVKFICGKIKIYVQFSSSSTPRDSSGFYWGMMYPSPRGSSNVINALISTSSLVFSQVTTNSSTTRLMAGSSYGYESYIEIGGKKWGLFSNHFSGGDWGYNWMGLISLSNSYQDFEKQCELRGGKNRNDYMTIISAPTWNGYPKMMFDNIEFNIEEINI